MRELRRRINDRLEGIERKREKRGRKKKGRDGRMKRGRNKKEEDQEFKRMEKRTRRRSRIGGKRRNIKSCDMKKRGNKRKSEIGKKR